MELRKTRKTAYVGFQKRCARSSLTCFHMFSHLPSNVKKPHAHSRCATSCCSSIGPCVLSQNPSAETDGTSVSPVARRTRLRQYWILQGQDRSPVLGSSLQKNKKRFKEPAKQMQSRSDAEKQFYSTQRPRPHFLSHSLLLHAAKTLSHNEIPSRGGIHAVYALCTSPLKRRCHGKPTGQPADVTSIH